MKFQTRMKKLLFVLAMAAMIATLLLIPLASAQPEADPGTEARGLLGLDDGVRDVGVEYVSDAPPAGAGGSDLPLCRTSARNLYNKLRAAGYTGSDSFIYANSLAWETDWKRSALGGSENTYVDDVDLAYYCDHGGSGSVNFPWDHTDNHLVPNDCYQSWGDRDNEWMAFGTCLTLTDRRGWANCLNGQHLILGYITVSYDADEGGEWAKQMLGYKFLWWWIRAPKTVTQAWFTMCDKKQPSSVTARVIAEHWRHFQDKLHGRGGPAYGDVVDNYYHWIDHRCHKPTPLRVDTSALASLPVYEVVPRTVDESYAANIVETLGMSGTLETDGEVFAITDTTGGVTRTLEVDIASGGYVYQNVSELWVPPDPGVPTALPGPEEAAQLAEGFFLANQALPGVQYRTDQEVETEQVAEVVKESQGPLKAGTILQEQGLDVMVSYGRRLATRSLRASEVSVVGPGSSTKLYLGEQGDVAAASQQLPLGLQGGARDVQDTGKTVPVQNADKAWNDFLEDHELAVAPIPLDADEIVRKPISDTLAYYEQPQGVSQAELIPVWVFYADFLREGELLASDVMVYVPVSPDYYPPTVTIDQPASGTSVRPGQVVTFSATATGPFQPFTYEWLSSHDGLLGTGSTITATLTSATHAGQVSSHTITVKVTNANGQSRTASIVLSVPPPIYLPTILKVQ